MRSPYENKKPRQHEFERNLEFLRGVSDGIKWLRSSAERPRSHSGPAPKQVIVRYKKRRHVEVPHG